MNKDKMHEAAIGIIQSLKAHSLSSELEGLEYGDFNDDEIDYICEVIWAILENPVIPNEFTDKENE